MISTKTIIEAASRVTGVPVAKLCGQHKPQSLVYIRAAIVQVALRQRTSEKTYWRFSFPLIGQAMHRDHSSVLHLRDMWPRYIEKRPELAELADQIAAEACKTDEQRRAEIDRRNAEWLAAVNKSEAERQARLERAERRAMVKPRNLFEPDDKHEHNHLVMMVQGSKRLLAALNEARLMAA